MDEQTIQRFWHDHACGDARVGGLRERFQGDYEKFFTDYDEFRYQNEHHLAACIDALNVNGKQVLEIGLGEGADSERLIRNGAYWSGVDLTAESIARVQTWLTMRELPYEELRQGSVLDLPFADGSFDIVFSQGVLHHVPEIKQAQKEIHRVLRPGGDSVIMVYAKWSLNYLVSITLVRRAALLAAFPPARAGLLKSDPSAESWPGISATPGSAGSSATCDWRSSSITTPTDPATRTRWCTTAAGSRRTFPLSCLPAAISDSCTHPLPVHQLPGETLMGCTCGLT